MIDDFSHGVNCFCDFEIIAEAVKYLLNTIANILEPVPAEVIAVFSAFICYLSCPRHQCRNEVLDSGSGTAFCLIEMLGNESFLHTSGW